MFKQGDNQLVFVRNNGFNGFVSWHGSYNHQEPDQGSILIKNKSGNIVMKVNVNKFVLHVIRSIFIKGRIEEGKKPRSIDIACFRLNKRASRILITGESYGRYISITFHRLESTITVLIDDGSKVVEKIFNSKSFIGANAGDYIERTMTNWSHAHNSEPYAQGDMVK